MAAITIEQHQPLSAVLDEDRKNWHKMLSDADTVVLEIMVDILKPL